VTRKGSMGAKPGADVYLTPPEVWARLHQVVPETAPGGGWWDPCPHPRPAADAVEACWPTDRAIYMNPPFSDLERFSAKAASHSQAGLMRGVWTPLVVLVPVRTSQPYWRTLCSKASLIAFWTGDKDQGGTIPRRMRFLGPTGQRLAGAPCDVALMMLTWGASDRSNFVHAFEDVATIVEVG